MSKDATPPAEVLIDDDVVRSLVRSQHPDLAPLPLGERHEGWDNVTIRLGDALAVRLPRRRLAAATVVTELDWLPRISAAWTFPVPRPLREGTPQGGYPWRWSVVQWIDGTPAYAAPLNAEGARDLGSALAQVHVPAPADAPRNPFRSHPLVSRAERLDLRLEALAAQHGDRIHADLARGIFEEGARQPAGPTTWAHLDIHGENILTTQGRLSGFLDWGDAAAGDPATDLGQALVLVGPSLFAELVGAYAAAGGAAATGGSLSEATAKHAEAEAIAYAALLAGIDETAYANAGWSALVHLGVAQRVTSDA